MKNRNPNKHSRTLSVHPLKKELSKGLHLKLVLPDQVKEGLSSSIVDIAGDAIVSQSVDKVPRNRIVATKKLDIGDFVSAVALQTEVSVVATGTLCEVFVLAVVIALDDDADVADGVTGIRGPPRDEPDKAEQDVSKMTKPC